MSAYFIGTIVIAAILFACYKSYKASEQGCYASDCLTFTNFENFDNK